MVNAVNSVTILVSSEVVHLFMVDIVLRAEEGRPAQGFC